MHRPRPQVSLRTCTRTCALVRADVRRMAGRGSGAGAGKRMLIAAQAGRVTPGEASTGQRPSVDIRRGSETPCAPTAARAQRAPAPTPGQTKRSNLLQLPSGVATGPRTHACDGRRHGARGQGRRAGREPKSPRSASQRQALRAPTAPAPGSSSDISTRPSSTARAHRTVQQDTSRRPRGTQRATWNGTRGSSTVRLHAAPASAYHQSSASRRGVFIMSQSSFCARTRRAQSGAGRCPGRAAGAGGGGRREGGQEGAPEAHLELHRVGSPVALRLP